MKEFPTSERHKSAPDAIQVMQNQYLSILTWWYTFKNDTYPNLPSAIMISVSEIRLFRCASSSTSIATFPHPTHLSPGECKAAILNMSLWLILLIFCPVMAFYTLLLSPFLYTAMWEVKRQNRSVLRRRCRPHFEQQSELSYGQYHDRKLVTPKTILSFLCIRFFLVTLLSLDI